MYISIHAKKKFTSEVLVDAFPCNVGKLLGNYEKSVSRY